MATRSWNKDRAAKRIDGKIADLPVKDIQIKEYVRDTDLTNLPSNVAYRVNGVHLYADILNLSEMLHVTDVEGETCHKHAPFPEPSLPGCLSDPAARGRHIR